MAPAHSARHTAVDVADLAKRQGVAPLLDFDALLAGCDFWPEDETADQFITAVRRWHREGPERGPR